MRGAEQQDGELVTRREHELQIGDHLVRSNAIHGCKLRPGRTLDGEQLR